MSLPKASASVPSFGQSLRGSLAECERLRTKLSAAARNADTQAHYTLALLAECRELFAAASTETVRRTAAGPVSDPAQSPACAGGAVQPFQPTNHKP